MPRGGSNNAGQTAYKSRTYGDFRMDPSGFRGKAPADIANRTNGNLSYTLVRFVGVLDEIGGLEKEISAPK